MAQNRNVQEIRQRILKERDAAKGRRFRFSEGLKREILQSSTATEGSLEAFCQSLTLSMSTLSRWRKSPETSPPSELPGSTGKPQLRRVTVAREATNDGSLTLRFPSGVELTGVSLAQIRELLGVAP